MDEYYAEGTFKIPKTLFLWSKKQIKYHLILQFNLSLNKTHGLYISQLNQILKLEWNSFVHSEREPPMFDYFWDSDHMSLFKFYFNWNNPLLSSSSPIPEIYAVEIECIRVFGGIGKCPIATNLSTSTTCPLIYMTGSCMSD